MSLHTVIPTNTIPHCLLSYQLTTESQPPHLCDGRRAIVGRETLLVTGLHVSYTRLGATGAAIDDVALVDGVGVVPSWQTLAVECEQ